MDEASAPATQTEGIVGEKGWVTPILCYLACFCFLYVAATGPLLKLADDGKIPKQCLWIYTPLQNVINGTPLEDALKWYVVKVWKYDLD